MGWVLVMVGVLLTLRCLRMWLFSAWIRETEQCLQSRLEAARCIEVDESNSVPPSSSTHLITYNETTSEADEGITVPISLDR